MTSTPRNVSKDADYLTAHRYLCVSNDGTTRITSTPPNLGWDEIALRLEIKLPRSLFRKPLLEAKINISKEEIAPVVLTTHNVNNVAKAIQKTTGLHVSLSVVGPEATEKSQ